MNDDVLQWPTRRFEAAWGQSQFAHKLSPIFEFRINATDDHWNRVLMARSWMDWGFWRWFKRACLLQGWKHR